MADLSTDFRCLGGRFVVLRHRMYRYEVHTLPSRLGR